jgi:hypothetical protein
LEFVEELPSGNWNLHFQGFLVRAMVPTSFVQVRALVENEIKRCMAHNRACPKQIRCTGYMLPSGILLATHIMFIPRSSGASQAFSAVIASADGALAVWRHNKLF